MNDTVFTEYIYELLKQQRDWPIVVLGRTLMTPAGSKAKMLRHWTFNMFDLDADDFKDKSDHDTFITTILYNLNWPHMLDLIKRDLNIKE